WGGGGGGGGGGFGGGGWWEYCGWTAGPPLILRLELGLVGGDEGANVVGPCPTAKIRSKRLTCAARPPDSVPGRTASEADHSVSTVRGLRPALSYSSGTTSLLMKPSTAAKNRTVKAAIAAQPTATIFAVTRDMPNTSPM